MSINKCMHKSENECLNITHIIQKDVFRKLFKWISPKAILSLQIVCVCVCPDDTRITIKVLWSFHINEEFHNQPLLPYNSFKI